MDSEQRHRSLYKAGASPQWKEAFRARCLERLRCNRRQLVEKFRGTSGGENADVQFTDDSEIDMYLSIMKEIESELLAEEQKLLEEYSKDYELDEDFVICPICKKDVLHQNHTVIFCACGMRIDVQQDGLTLEHLRNELRRGLGEHDPCPSPPAFSLLSLPPSNHLTITCGTCDFMYIVI